MRCISIKRKKNSDNFYKCHICRTEHRQPCHFPRIDEWLVKLQLLKSGNLRTVCFGQGAATKRTHGSVYLLRTLDSLNGEHLYCFRRFQLNYSFRVVIILL